MSIEYNIPTYEDGEWSETQFASRDDFKEFILSLFKEPGQYEFDETSRIFNEQARNFNKNGYYCDSPVRTKDYIKYWDNQIPKICIYLETTTCG
jgi:hypothetical protein